MAELDHVRDLDPRITLARLRVFVVLADLECSVTRAADELRQTPNAVRQNLDLLQAAFGGRNLFSRDRRSLSDFGRQVYREAREMVLRWAALSNIGSTTVRITFLPQHATFVSAAMRRLREAGADVECTTQVLSEQDRSMVVFEENVIGALLHGATDLVIGPPPRKIGNPPALDRHHLYTSRLEAMISVEEGRESLELADLVQRRLLVPPLPVRSRQLLEREIAEHIPGDPGIPARVAHEAYSTKVLVAFGQDGHGTVVVPSDIAFPFKPGSSFAGARAGAFTWVPVRRSGADLTQDVYVTSRVNPGERALRVIAELRAAVAEAGFDIRQ